MSDSPEAVRRALSHLRAHHAGLLLYDEIPLQRRFVIDGRTGRLVMPATFAVLSAAEHVLFVPQESDDSLQLLLTPREIDADSEPADRWKAYHGEPRESRWASFRIESGKLGRSVYTGEDLEVPNLLAPVEPALCKRVNQNPAALGDLCRERLGVSPEKPLMVGIDPDGIDIRLRFDILRAPFAERATNPAEAAAAVDQLLH